MIEDTTQTVETPQGPIEESYWFKQVSNGAPLHFIRPDGDVCDQWEVAKGDRDTAFDYFKENLLTLKDGLCLNSGYKELMVEQKVPGFTKSLWCKENETENNWD